MHKPEIETAIEPETPDADEQSHRLRNLLAGGVAVVSLMVPVAKAAQLWRGITRADKAAEQVDSTYEQIEAALEVSGTDTSESWRSFDELSSPAMISTDTAGKVHVVFRPSTPISLESEDLQASVDSTKNLHDDLRAFGGTALLGAAGLAAAQSIRKKNSDLDLPSEEMFLGHRGLARAWLLSSALPLVAISSMIGPQVKEILDTSTEQISASGNTLASELEVLDLRIDHRDGGLVDISLYPDVETIERAQRALRQLEQNIPDIDKNLPLAMELQGAAFLMTLASGYATAKSIKYLPDDLRIFRQSLNILGDPPTEPLADQRLREIRDTLFPSSNTRNVGAGGRPTLHK